MTMTPVPPPRGTPAPTATPPIPTGRGRYDDDEETAGTSPSAVEQVVNAFKARRISEEQLRAYLKSRNYDDFAINVIVVNAEAEQPGRITPPALADSNVGTAAGGQGFIEGVEPAPDLPAATLMAGMKAGRYSPEAVINRGVLSGDNAQGILEAWIVNGIVEPDSYLPGGQPNPNQTVPQAEAKKPTFHKFGSGTWETLKPPAAPVGIGMPGGMQ